jgi:hypothetical protein
MEATQFEIGLRLTVISSRLRTVEYNCYAFTFCAIKELLLYSYHTVKARVKVHSCRFCIIGIGALGSNLKTLLQQA